jgi:hypothetical protein
MKKILFSFGIMLLLNGAYDVNAEALKPEPCNRRTSGSITAMSVNNLFVDGTSYTVRAQKPTGQCDYLGRRNSVKSCQKIASKENFACFQVTEGTINDNAFFKNGRIHNSTFQACWGCF